MTPIPNNVRELLEYKPAKHRHRGPYHKALTIARHYGPEAAGTGAATFLIAAALLGARPDLIEELAWLGIMIVQFVLLGVARRTNRSQAETIGQQRAQLAIAERRANARWS